MVIFAVFLTSDCKDNVYSEESWVGSCKTSKNSDLEKPRNRMSGRMHWRGEVSAIQRVPSKQRVIMVFVCIGRWKI